MLLAALVTLSAYLLLVLIVNRVIQPAAVVKHRVHRQTESPVQLPTRELQLVSWNLGYAGLGRDSNFVADGGTDFLPPSRAHVRRNVEGISKVIANQDADIFLFQEIAGPSLVNRQVDLRSAVVRTLKDWQYVYSADVRTRLIPSPLKIDVGNAVFSKFPIAAAEAKLLPLEGYIAGLVRKNYRMLITRLELSENQQLVVVNVHLAAFDEAANIRRRQLSEVHALAAREFAQGHFVIVGGDWNLRLVKTDFPHRTDEKYLFWLADFPDDLLTDGWSIAADDRVPTVRTDHKSYAEGDNYVCVIDGFILSPNVELLNIANVDLGFEHSDHQPASLRVRLKPGPGDLAPMGRHAKPSQQHLKSTRSSLPSAQEAN